MYWIAATVDEQSKSHILQFRDSLYNQIDDRAYEKEDFPHITILPGFTTDDISQVKQAVSTVETEFTVTFDEYHIWPSVENPMVVALEPMNTDVLDSIRNDVMQVVRDVGDVKFEPKPFHLTLFKGGDSGDENSFDAPVSSVELISEFEQSKTGLPITVQFTSIELEDWSV